MNGRISDATTSPLSASLAVAAAALAWPPLAVLLLAGLGAHALMRAQTRLDARALIGPVVASLIVGAFVGVAGAIGVLFAWRLVADARWSVNEAARLAMLAGRPQEASWKVSAHAWTTPLYGLALVAYTAPHMVAGLPLDRPHVPAWVPLGMGAIAALAVFDWGVRRAADWRLGELAAAPAMHLLTHHAIFLIAFGLTLDVSAGIAGMLAWRLAHAAPLRQPSFTAVP
jgi:hypothetical protein